MQPRVLGFIDHSHAAVAEFGNHAIMRNDRANQIRSTPGYRRLVSGQFAHHFERRRRNEMLGCFLMRQKRFDCPTRRTED